MRSDEYLGEAVRRSPILRQRGETILREVASRHGASYAEIREPLNNRGKNLRLARIEAVHLLKEAGFANSVIGKIMNRSDWCVRFYLGRIARQKPMMLNAYLEGRLVNRGEGK